MGIYQLLLSLPKTLLVVLVLGFAIIFIVANDPPHNICRTQINHFKAVQSGTLYRDSKIKTRKKPLLSILIGNCKQYSSPGSCYGLFSKMRTFIGDFKLIASDCYKPFSLIPEVKGALLSVYGLMIRLAWGGEPPKHYDKLGWFSEVDVALFCLVKKQIITLYGKEVLLGQEQRTFKKLPGAKTMSLSAIKETSIVSENCSLYPPL